MDDALTTIKQILEWGFLGFMLYINRVYWDELKKSREAHLADLRTLAGLREKIIAEDRPFTFPTSGSEFAGPSENRPQLK